MWVIFVFTLLLFMSVTIACVKQYILIKDAVTGRIKSTASRTLLFSSSLFDMAVIFSQVSCMSAYLDWPSLREKDILHAAVCIIIQLMILLATWILHWIHERKARPLRKEASSKWAFCLQGKGTLIISDPESTTVAAVMCDGTIRAICMNHPVGMYLRRMPDSRAVYGKNDIEDLLI